MKLLTVLKHILRRPQKVAASLDDYKQEALVQQGRIQFEKLLQKGLSIPVVIL